MRYWIFLFYTVGLVTACTSGNGTAGESAGVSSSDTTALEKQVMAIHDEVMPRLNEINHLSAQLRRIRERLPEAETGKKAVPEGMEQVVEALKLADQSMWDWMKAYNDGKAATPAGNLADFYRSQLDQVNIVKEKIDSAIANAQAWIKANSPE